MDHNFTGAGALAQGALDAGVSLVTSYAGAPITTVVGEILRRTSAAEVHVEWMSNEKVALEAAFGASLGGMRALLCVKSVGLNVALDPLMAINLAGSHAGLVVLVGDDPGGWGSQNEQDSRWIALAAELPLLEPCTTPDAHLSIPLAFQLSEELRIPVMVRVTQSLVTAGGDSPNLQILQQLEPESTFVPYDTERRVVLPIDVVSLHYRLLEKLDALQVRFEDSPLNSVQGDGTQGVIAAGFSYQKLMDLLDGVVAPELRILKLGTLNPLPRGLLLKFLQAVESCLVLEETAPILERALRGVAQAAGITASIQGRDTGHVDRTGETSFETMSAALARYLPEFGKPAFEAQPRSMPSREPLCDGCPYVPTFEALMSLIDQQGDRENVIVVGDPGCMVRAQLPPYELLDVKTSLGSSIATAAGIALRNKRDSEAANSERGTDRRVVALVGDSGFFHSGIQGLVDAIRLGVRLLVILLDNGVTALSGGQPHPGSLHDARGRTRQAIDLSKLLRQSGVERVAVVDLDRGESIQQALADAWQSEGVSVVVARGQCILTTSDAG